MSFLDALGELKVGEGTLFRLELPNVFKSVFSIFQKIYDSFNAIIKKLSIMHKTLSVKENWTYKIDEETGIQVLDVERDDTAVERTRNALQDLFL